MISIVACLYLMFQLPTVTWIRFAVWLVVASVLVFRAHVAPDATA